MNDKGNGSRKYKLDFDDKDLAMLAITVIVLACLYKMGVDAKDIAMAAITAIGSLASGRFRRNGGVS